MTQILCVLWTYVHTYTHAYICIYIHTYLHKLLCQVCFKFVTKFYNVLRHFPSNCNFIIIICMHMCVSIASVCKLLRTVLPTCCKNVCGQVQTTNCSTHTHTHWQTHSGSINFARQGALWLHANTRTYIIAMYVCAQGKEKTKQNKTQAKDKQ